MDVKTDSSQISQLVKAYDDINQTLRDIDSALDSVTGDAIGETTAAAARFAQNAREMITQVENIIVSEQSGADATTVSGLVGDLSRNYTKAVDIRAQFDALKLPDVNGLLAVMDELFNSSALSQLTSRYLSVSELADAVSLNAKLASNRLASEQLDSEPYQSPTVGDVYGQVGAKVVADNFTSVTRSVERLATAIVNASTGTAGENALKAQDVLNTIDGLKGIHADTDLSTMELNINTMLNAVTDSSMLLASATPSYGGIGQYKLMLDSASRAAQRIALNISLVNVNDGTDGPMKIDNDAFVKMLSSVESAKSALLNRISLLDDKFAENFQQRVNSNAVNVGLLKGAISSYKDYATYDDVDNPSAVDTGRSRRAGYVANRTMSGLHGFDDLTTGADAAHRFSEMVAVNARTYLDDVRAVDRTTNSAGKTPNVDDVGRELRVHIHNLVAAMNAERLVNPNGSTLESLRALHAEAVDAANQLDAVDKGRLVDRYADDVISSFGTVAAFIGGGLAMMGLGGVYSAKKMADNTFKRYELSGETMYNSAMADFGATGNFDAAAARGRLTAGQRIFNATSGNIEIDEVAKSYSSILTNVGGHYGASTLSARADVDALTSNLFSISRASGLSQSTMEDALKLFYKDSNMGSAEASTAVANVVERARQSNVPVEQYAKTVVSIGLRLRDVGVYGPAAVELIGDLTEDGMRLEDASSLVEHTAGAQTKLASSWSQSILYGNILNGKGGNPWATVLSNNLTHDANGNLIGDHYGSLGAQLKTKYNFTLQMSGGGSAGYANVIRSMMADGYTQRDASQLTSLMMSGDDAKLSKTLEGIDDRKENADKDLTKAIDKANAALAAAGAQSSEITKMLTDAKSATMDLATLIDEKLGPTMRMFSGTVNSAIDSFEGSMETLIDVAAKLAENPLTVNVLSAAAANPLTTIGLVTLGSGVVGATGLAMLNVGRRALSSAAGNVANRGLVAASRLVSSGAWRRLGGRYALIPAAVGAGLLATTANASASPSTKLTAEQLNITLVDGSAKVNVINRDKFFGTTGGDGGAVVANVGSTVGAVAGLRALIAGSQHAGALSAIAATSVGGELLSSDDRPASTKLMAGGSSALTTLASVAGGGVLARRFGFGKVGTFAAMAGGGLAGSALSKQINRALGIATASDDALTERSAILKQTADAYGNNVIQVLDSDSEQGRVMRSYLEKNGIDYGTLTGLQKAMLLEMFTKLAGAHQSLDKTLRATATALKNNKTFNRSSAKNANGKPVVLSADADAKALEDAYMHVQHGNGVYDENYYRGQYAQAKYNELKELHDAEDDLSKRSELNEQMTFYSSIVSYIKHLNGDDDDLNEEVDKQWNAPEFAMAQHYTTKDMLREATLTNWRKRYDDDDFVNAAGYSYYDANVVELAKASVQAQTSYTPAKVGSGQGAYGRVPYVEWKNAIDAAAAKNGVDPKLMAAMFECESGWDPNAKSGAGAVGLAQFMPETARGLGIDPTDPMQAIAGEAAYLRQIQDQLGSSDPALLAAAYNAGPEAVRQAGGVPGYAETQGYVKKVLAAYGDGAGVTPGHWTGATGNSAPRTLADQAKASQQAYAAILTANGGHIVQGRIVNGMYVAAGQQADSVESILANAVDLTPPKPTNLALRQRSLSSRPTEDASKAASKAADEAAKVLDQSKATMSDTVAVASAKPANGDSDKTDENTAIMSVAGKLKPGKTMEGLRSDILKMISENSGNVNVIKA